ncbi:2486_t:CDS:2 [Gigaspora margarita]|uniref:2486_t:CDS:1 n=1 Tax=Gigaspora margarita TaxID=4874 RepID=A0ABN7VDR6_GIGMA|nr:2486_t:CDS:2 [Gigaspora margarita]
MEEQSDNKVESLETIDEYYEQNINTQLNVSKILCAIIEKFQEINSQYSNISEITLLELQNLNSQNPSMIEITSAVIKIILEISSKLSSADMSEIIEELCKLKEYRYEFMSAINKELPKIVKNPSILYYFMSELVEELAELANVHPDILSEFLKKCVNLRLPPELAKALKEKETRKSSKMNGTFECVMKFGTVKVLDTSIRPLNLFTRIFGRSKPKTKYYLPLPGLFNKSTSLRNLSQSKLSTFEELASLRSIEICQSPVFEAIIIQRKSFLIDRLYSGMFLYHVTLRRTISKSLNTFVTLASKFFPLITVILEFYNKTAPPELRTLSILFLWWFIAIQLRYIKEVGIFIANLPPDNKDIPNTFINFGKSLKNVWLMLQGDYISLAPWSDHSILDTLRIALMNNAYERTYKHARAVWTAYIAEVIADFGFSVNGDNDPFNNVSYIVYEAPNKSSQSKSED